ncbi:uncharacterized protein PRCAT00001975001 [Priceomyces carsonii]|uniref:uncharacterized protein n=1 Tax=Priceomyces carsonii TaxID=28549 RepID=UPI002EDA8BCB|nr:unnamed protein product [Priceomyces carsonii]
MVDGRRKCNLDIQNVIGISNSNKNLIPVGVLYFFDLPIEQFDLKGDVARILRSNNEATDDDGWMWLNLDLLVHRVKGKVSEFVDELHFLIKFRYIVGTYKLMKLFLLDNKWVVIAVVRIYSIPSDVSGSRYFKQWRGSFPKNFEIEKKYRSCWFNLIAKLDFSDDSWHARRANSTFFEFCHNLKAVLPFFSTKYYKFSEISTNELNYHIDRWTKNEPFTFYPKKIDEGIEALSSKIQNIYSAIKPPDVSHSLTQSRSVDPLIPSANDVIGQLVQKKSNARIPGLKSELYSFQVISLAKMFEKESFLEKSLLPNLIQLKSPSYSKNYYFDVLSSRLLEEPELFTLPRGGILAENMGLGKTIICLSLVCLTKCEVSNVPDDLILFSDPTTVIKEQENGIFVEGSRRNKMLKLAELCQHHINRNSLPWKYYTDYLPSSVIARLANSPGFFRVSLDNFEELSKFSLRTRKVSSRAKELNKNLPQENRNYRTLYLCNTTLIIVPDNLFHQWINELKKHVDQSYLNKLFVSNQFKKTHVKDFSCYTSELNSNPLDLIKYDLIVISSSLLAMQFDKLHENSPLLKVYWKRLIIDEGHSISSKRSRISLLCKNLYSERRWSVTGTPTSGLTKLHMDEEQSEQLVPVSPKKQKKYIVQHKFNGRDDLVKLGTIISNFLKIEPFHSQQKLWSSSVINPLISNAYGSTIGLTNLLNSIMIRHNPGDIEHDLTLPRLHHEAVFLEPSYHNKLSINLFTAVLAVNAVSSERTDVDYMFHPSNRQQLRRLITNLQRATFHWTGFKQQDVETLLHICNFCLQKRKATGASVYSDYDISLLKNSIEASKMALGNPQWRTVALLHEMPYYISNLPDVFTKSFGIGVVESTNDRGYHDDISVFGAPHLNAVQEFFYKNRFMDMNDEEKLKLKLDVASKPFWDSYWKYTFKKNFEKFNKQDKNQDFRSDVKSEDVSNAIHNPSVLLPTNDKFLFSTSRKNVKEKNLENPKDKLTSDQYVGLRSTEDIVTNRSLSSHNISFDSIKRAIILGTASAKLSYLGSRLLEHQETNVKSIVFFEFEDSAYYLTELLDALGINYILYATFISPSQRANNLSEYSNHPNEEGGLTLVMDLRLAAHGLTILAATRVYFISPVWQRSIEAQAIKRAHRIGQKNEIFVETLVLKGTLEEEIYKKRSSGSDSLKGEQKYVIDDTGMQDFILKHEFLRHEINEPEYEPFVATASKITEDLKSENNEHDEFGLMKHSSSILDNNTIKREWEVYLFSEQNLAKMNRAKNQKVYKEYAKEEFIRDIVSSGPDKNTIEPMKRHQEDKYRANVKRVKF